MRARLPKADHDSSCRPDLAQGWVYCATCATPTHESDVFLDDCRRCERRRALGLPPVTTPRRPSARKRSRYRGNSIQCYRGGCPGLGRRR